MIKKNKNNHEAHNLEGMRINGRGYRYGTTKEKGRGTYTNQSIMNARTRRIIQRNGLRSAYLYRKRWWQYIETPALFWGIVVIICFYLANS